MKDWNDLKVETGVLPDPRAKALPMNPVPISERNVDLDSFFLGKLFGSYGWVGRRISRIMWAARCPSEELHGSGERLDGSTRLMAPDEKNSDGSFVCTHPSCSALRPRLDELGVAIERIALEEGL